MLISFSIFPLDKGESVSEYTARAVKIIHESGYPYRLSPMETIVETETVEEAFDLIKRCFDALKPDCNRIICHIRIDYRKGRKSGIISKVKSVEEKLGQKLESL